MFPKIHNGARPVIKEGKTIFTYITSLGDVITETKEILDPEEIKEIVMNRMYRFKEAGPGSRESEISRAERKWISAHPESILKETYELLDEHGKMEMSMMLDMNSHFGISDKKWADKNVEERKHIIGDNGSVLV